MRDSRFILLLMPSQTAVVILQMKKEKIMPIRDQWVAETEAKGLPAKKVYNEFLRLVEKYSK